MHRKDFLSAIGMSSAGLVLACLGCSKNSSGDSMPSLNAGTVDFTIDLAAPSNAALLQKGGYQSFNGVLVAHTLTDNYIAVQQSCTHENYPLTYQGGSQRFYCNNHQATFSEAGTVTGGPTRQSLSVFKTSLTGTSLRIFI